MKPNQDIKELIQKIHEEGIQAAEERARQIEATAQKKAEELISQAKKEAEALIAEAKKEAEQLKAYAQAAVQQVARDIIILLKNEINQRLSRILKEETEKALDNSALLEVIGQLLETALKDKNTNVELKLNKEMLERLKSVLLSRLAEELKKGLVLTTREDAEKGLLISFDAGRSYFDFSAEAIAEYLRQRLAPEVWNILEGRI